MKNYKFAEIAYNAYCKSRDWKSIKGELLPKFWEQSTEIMDAWWEAAEAVKNEWMSRE